MESIPVIKKTRPKSKPNRKLIALLMVFFIILLIVLFFNSTLSRIHSIEISGNELIADEVIGQASGIRVDDSFFSLDLSKIEAKLSELAWVDTAHISRKFPGQVKIEIEERKLVAYELMPDGSKVAVLADGGTLPAEDQLPAKDKIVLTGWESEEKLKHQLAITLADIPPDWLKLISEIRPLPSDSYPDKILLYTRTSFEVVTTVGYLHDKMSYLPNMLQDLYARDITEGRLTLLEADIHSPF